MLVRNGYGWLVALGAVALVGSGCSDDGSSRRSSGGGREGGIMIMEDGGTDGSTETDGGGMTGSCRENMVPSWGMAPPCSSNLIPCLQACPMGDNACFSACFDAEPDECGLCINQEIISCANMNGCQDEWNCFTTCAEDNCVDAMGNIDRACVDSTCSEQSTAFDTCVSGLPRGTCDIAACIQTGGGTGGGGGM